MNYWSKKGTKLINEIENEKLLGDQVAFWHLGQVGFAVRYADKVIMIDPVLTGLVENGQNIRIYESAISPEKIKVDYVLCTHGHIDHMAEDTLRGLLRANPDIKIVIPYGCLKFAKEYEIPEENLILCVDKDVVKLDKNIEIECLSTAHPVHTDDKNDEMMSLAYALKLGKTRMLHLGDTYLTERLYFAIKELGKVNIFMAPINGDDLFRKMKGMIGNMEAEEAARLALDIKADLSIPMHFDMIKGNTANPDRFVNILKENDRSAKYYIPVLGAKYIY